MLSYFWQLCRCVQDVKLLRFKTRLKRWRGRLFWVFHSLNNDSQTRETIVATLLARPGKLSRIYVISLLNKEPVRRSCCTPILELNTFLKQRPSRQEHSGEKYSQVFWQIHKPNDPLWLICEELNIVQPACFSLWDHEHLLAHNYIVIHCYLAEETSDDS